MFGEIYARLGLDGGAVAAAALRDAADLAETDTVAHASLFLGLNAPIVTYVGAAGLSPLNHIAGASDAQCSLFMGRYSGVGASTLAFGRSRSTTIGGHAALQNADVMGTLTFGGSDGTQFQEGLQLRALATGAVTATGAPTRGFLCVNDGLSVSPNLAVIFNPTSLTLGIDNVSSLGSASFRWSQVWAASTRISSSDAQLKKIRPGGLSDAELRAISRVKREAFQFLAAIDEKGADGARIHFGCIAQAFEVAFEAEGLDVRKYALFCEEEIFEDVTTEVEETYEEAVMVEVTTEVAVIDGVARRDCQEFRVGDGHSGPDGGSRWHDAKLLAFLTRFWTSFWAARIPRRRLTPTACSTI